ncbi:hypothetical protein E1B28_009208 [Marasmius oreades]|uniref:DUF6533 domain-containing protein n=1 Tax=Marasmius oreades TaxID=181124 RepID=A0A9P7S189_9AGAR|nr:uncharacterized protein E1B28_009208 [Marasmius oreades]KAG7092901.1 hypothetical protein E1B28_009208 [Marasmius oreades]
MESYQNWLKENDARLANYFLVSGYAALLHDIVLTLPREVRFISVFEFSMFDGAASFSKLELIWSTPFTRASLMYILMRYGNVIWQGVTLAFHICSDAPHLSCEAWYLIVLWITYALYLPTTVFLSLRMYALHRDQEWHYKWLMICIFGSLHCTILVCLGVQTNEIFEYSWSANCNTNTYNAVFVPIIAIVLYYTSLLGLTLHRVCKYFRAGEGRIIHIVSQDALLFTAVLTLASIATLVVCITQRPSLHSLPLSLLATLAVITSSRLVLNLKKIVIEPDLIALRTLTAAPMTLDTLGPISFRSRAQVDWEEGCLPPRPTK